jgi:hypothetical protein
VGFQLAMLDRPENCSALETVYRQGDLCSRRDGWVSMPFSSLPMIELPLGISCHVRRIAEVGANV